jgi:Putative beta-barrel porin-2, OmpL-like. bbp2
MARLSHFLMTVALVQLPVMAIAQATPAAAAEQRINELSKEVESLKAMVLELRDQVSRLAPPAPAAMPTPPAPVAAAPAKATVDALRGVTINALVDGYYEYNSNSPVGRVNQLRAYDVSSNSFSLNQADVILESAPDIAADKRYGLRLDLQFGQATSTLQGSAANELRPDIYRNVYQAYGTYIFPIAEGLSIDFGKWASSLGIEGNYTQDQLNYSRSFWFDYLPFYHMGVRSKLALNDQLAINFWLTNGTNQTEDFNKEKDAMLGFVVTPHPGISWTLNYYRGQEHPDVVYLQSAPPVPTNLPIQQGTYVVPISNAPNGTLEIIDSYISWQATQALSLAAEADYVQERLYSFSSPSRVSGGAVYAGYQLSRTLGIAARGEYLADIGGLFSGETQYLKEETFTFDYRPESGFLLRAEYRRDQSNQHYFYGHALGLLEMTQPTIGVGLVWWFGQKNGPW